MAACLRCKGSPRRGWVVVKTAGGVPVLFDKCPDCINGEAHCCDGDQAQPKPDDVRGRYIGLDRAEEAAASVPGAMNADPATSVAPSSQSR